MGKGDHKAPTKVPSNLAFQKKSIQNTRKDWLWSFLVAWVLLNSIRPTSLMYAWKIPLQSHHPFLHFSQHYPLQPSKIPCEYFIHSCLLASVLASNYPNVNPKCELQAWWTNEWFLFQWATAKLIECELCC